MNTNNYKNNLKLATAYIVSQPFTGLVPLDDGFKRGSIFNNLYVPYKKFKNPLDNVRNFKSEYNQLMYMIQQLGLLTLDLGLFLDTHPDDGNALSAFNIYQKELRRYKKLYEQKYGPLTIESENLFALPWKWVNEPWPWEHARMWER